MHSCIQALVCDSAVRHGRDTHTKSELQFLFVSYARLPSGMELMMMPLGTAPTAYSPQNTCMNLHMDVQ